MGLGLVAWSRFAPAGAQTSFPDASGVWTGTLGGGIGLELRLTQDGQNLSGYGTYVPEGGGKVLDFEVAGEETASGLVLLNTSGRAEGTGNTSVLTVEMSLAGDQAQAQVVDGQAQTSTSLGMTRVLQGDPTGAELQASTDLGGGVPVGRQVLRLWNNDLTPFQKYSPPETYRVDAVIEDNPWQSDPQYDLHLNVKLAGSLLTELAGSWSIDQAANNTPGVLPALGSATFTNGRVAAWNVIVTGRSRFIFKTPETISVLGDIVFDRLKSGQPGASYVIVNPFVHSNGMFRVTAPKGYGDKRNTASVVTLVSP